MVENKGWAFATNGKKRHYYIAGESLCGRHEFYGYVSDFHHNSSSNCEICKEKLAEKHERLYRRATMTTQHNPLQHTSLAAAMIVVQSLISQGHTSFKVFRELGLWNVIVNGEVK